MTLRNAAALAARHAQMLVKLNASEGRIEAAFSFFIRKRAPVSGLASLLDYEGRWIAETRAGATTPMGNNAEAIYALFDRLGYGGKDFSGIIGMLRDGS